MKRLFAIVLAFMALPLAAQEYDYKEDLRVKIWDNVTAPHSNELTTPETSDRGIVQSVTEAELFVFKANPEKATGQAIVICPGGGYEAVCMTYEGVDAARWLAANGITCGVLKYRLPNGHREVPLEDALEALRLMRRNAAEWNLDPDQVGIMGFSAGGHLAAYASTFAPLGEEPAFSVLMYAVITGEWGLTHEGTFNHLLGEGHTAADRAEYSPENRVTKRTPPAILLLSDDDKIVPPISSTRYYNALKKFGIDASLHIYPDGWHGWGMSTRFPYREQWQLTLLSWLQLHRKMR